LRLFFVSIPHIVMQPKVALHCGDRTLTLDRPRVMGILNVTPDSFSDGGKFVIQGDALLQAEHMVSAGADIIDVGGESTRPGAAEVAEQVELDRVIPLISAIKERFDIIVSVDTSKPAVMREAAASGAGLINDVRSLQEHGAESVVAQTGLPVCLMHMQGEPRTMQHRPKYEDVVSEVATYLDERRLSCIQSGVAASQIVLDPGFGFGKNLAHNMALLRELNQLCEIAPVLIGLSRKRMFAQILNSDGCVG